MPPSQLVMAFQRIRERGMVSRGMVHAPVVVHPDTDSKTQSMKE